MNDHNYSFRREEFEVRGITYDDTREWLLYKHYAHRMPSISFAYGLYRDNTLVGVCTYGYPATGAIAVGAFGGKYAEFLFELNRLCVNDDLPLNALSFFVGQTFKLLPKPCILVSYADSGQNHHGYIYQATNWVYTGLTKPHNDTILIGDEHRHPRHTTDRYGGGRSEVRI